MKLPKYQNLDTEKNQILSANKGKSGIYMFENKINGKRYIGSSEDLSFSPAVAYLNINSLIRDNGMQICRALLKYGYPNFSLTILDYCDNLRRKMSRKRGLLF